MNDLLEKFNPYRKLRKALDIALFSDFVPLIKLSQSKQLKLGDLPKLPDRFDPRRAGCNFDASTLGSGWRFIYGLVLQEKRSLVILWTLSILMAAAQLYSPYLIYRLLQQVTSAIQGRVQLTYALLTAVLLGGINLTNAILNQHFMYHMLSSRQVLINIVNRWIYQHALKLRFWDASGVHVGTITNHMSTDTDRVSFTFWLIADLFYSVITFISVFIMLYHYLGTAMVAAPALLLLLLPLIRKVGHWLTNAERGALEFRDERVNLITQFFGGIRTIKYYAWEWPIYREVDKVREQELSRRGRWAIALSMSTFIFTSIQVLLPLFTFSAYVLLGNHLDIPVVFACVALFQLLVRPIGSLSHIFAGITDARVAAERLCRFFVKSTRDEGEDQRELSAADRPIGVTLRDVTVTYGDDASTVTSPINLSVQPGESVAIVGPVGAGKSTLLLSILNEVQLSGGSIYFDNIAAGQAPRIAYTAQTPFIMNASITANVLMNSADNVDISEAIYACALEEDLTALPARERSEIGENGINLSGGQKHRIGLARAFMHRPGLVLLDDPLSAVDVRTEAVIVERLIFGKWQQITRIVVTHRLEHLDRFDKIIFMEHGQIVAAGTLTSIIEHSSAFLNFYQKHLSTFQQPTISAPAGGQVTQEVDAAAVGSAAEYNIIAEEDQQQGAVSWPVFQRYFMAMVAGKRPRLLLYLLFLGILAASLLPILQTVWLSIWLNQTSVISGFGWLNHIQPGWMQGERIGLLVYFSLGFSALLAIYCQYYMWIMRSIHAGRILHAEAFKRVLFSPVQFFDANPVGRIVNRFASDVDTLETELTWSLQECIGSLLDALGSILLIVIIMPITLLAFLPLSFFFMNLQRVYRSAARDIRRLYSISRSPRFAHFKETLAGIATIRSYQKQEPCWDRFFGTLSDNQRAFYSMTMSARWFSVRLPLLNAIISIIVIVGIIFLAQHHWIAPATAGLVTVYSLGFWMSLNWAIRAYAIAESNMTAAERVMHYCNLAPEPSHVIEPALAEQVAWPSGGQIEVNDLCIRYAANLPLVIEHVTFRVPAGAKVAIVGKTGSGKTTLLKALFRFVSIESGNILVDGVDIGRIPLERLRKSIAIIPQDPVLFSGTLRDNLDRFKQYSDEEILAILNQVKLFEILNKVDQGLATVVTDQGANYSQGERQLICLARALLGDAKIIVLDEPTSSVDVRTDYIVQKAIRGISAGRTVIIVAHRLNTIHDCDLVIELKEGKIADQV